MAQTYEQLLQSKIKRVHDAGFIVDESMLNKAMFPFQKHIGRIALKKGRYAIFSDCGTGKTLIQLDWANQVSTYTGKPVLILAYLAVVGQTILEGVKFGIEVTEASLDINNPHFAPIQIANYEQLENIDISIYSGIVLDESSILKNFEGATRTLIIESFAATPYKLACTATPSPNDPMELGNHAEFLNVMSRAEMLAMYFVHDGGETAKWRLKGHCVKLFWSWVSSWAIMLSKPSDIGFSDEGYDLPALNYIEKHIKTRSRDNGQLFNDVAISATNFNAELRMTKIERLDTVAEIVNGSKENFIIWIKQNEEGDYLRKIIPDAVEIAGSDSLERKKFVSLWFGNQNNECTCDTRETNSNTRKNIGQSTVLKSAKNSTPQTTNGLKSEEKQILNLDNQGLNTAENTTEITRINSIAEHLSNPKNGTKSAESDMLPIQNTERSKSSIPLNPARREMNGLTTPCESNTGLLSKSTMECLSAKNQDVQYAGTSQHSSTQNNGYTLTTATPQDASEACFAQTAIKESESLMIAKYCSNVPLCTCCGKHKRKVLISKTKILSFGLNYQNCHNQVFASLDFSFEGLYQAIRRSYRFGQLHPVNIYLITTDTMANVIEAIRKKQSQFETMQHEMEHAINSAAHENSAMREFKEVKTVSSVLQLGDCVQLVKNIPDESIGLSVFSPPFAELYTYSDELEDMGNSKDYGEFLLAFGFLIKDLFRIMWSGRNVAVHCMDLPIQKGKEGYIGLRDFSGMILRAFEDAGFIYHSRVTIWKNPVTEMQRTKALGLLHKQIKKDASMSRVGIPDYLLVFRKPGEHLHPVIHQDKDPMKPGYLPVDLWQSIASPVWMDIDYGNTLNGRAGRDERDEKHICPLQLDTIERATHLWSNKGDTCYTPFGGVGSEAFQWVKMERKAVLHELKTSYFDVAVKNVMAAESEKMQAKIMFV